ncbi:MAG TPA: Uma2 family endonuclease [Thermoanaerobaculia bacterium]|nr:Uma2 family endonuclease [Thermoanaerobaculia bacterium]
MSSQPDLAADFAAMETLVESYGEGVNAEIARGVFMMSPRPTVRHLATQGRLVALFHERLGKGRDGEPPDWLFLPEPEIRSETAFSRLIPDIAGWRRSAGGWPDTEINPIEIPPEWAAEVLSPGTATFDRGPKKDAFGLMGVGWLWLIDVDERAIETFSNERGRMVPGPEIEIDQSLIAPPFGDLSARVDELFLD